MKITCRSLFSINICIKSNKLKPFPSSEIIPKLKLKSEQNNFCSKFHEYCRGCHCFRYCFWRPLPHSLVQIKFSDWLELCKPLSWH